jgi:hypothetical protein
MRRKVKCAMCGREDVAITKKGYLAPHITPAALRCHFVVRVEANEVLRKTTR